MAWQLSRIPDIARYVLDGVFLGLLIADGGVTIYQLAQSSALLSKLHKAREELRFQLELDKAELSQRLSDAKADLDEAAMAHHAELLEARRARHAELLARTERLTRRFRAHYADLRVGDELADTLESVNQHGALMKAKLHKARQEKKARKAAAKSKIKLYLRDTPRWDTAGYLFSTGKQTDIRDGRILDCPVA